MQALELLHNSNLMQHSSLYIYYYSMNITYISHYSRLVRPVQYSLIFSVCSTEHLLIQQSSLSFIKYHKYRSCYRLSNHIIPYPVHPDYANIETNVISYRKGRKRVWLNGIPRHDQRRFKLNYWSNGTSRRQLRWNISRVTFASCVQGVGGKEGRTMKKWRIRIWETGKRRE